MWKNYYAQHMRFCLQNSCIFCSNTYQKICQQAFSSTLTWIYVLVAFRFKSIIWSTNPCIQYVCKIWWRKSQFCSYTAQIQIHTTQYDVFFQIEYFTVESRCLCQIPDIQHLWRNPRHKCVDSHAVLQSQVCCCSEWILSLYYKQHQRHTHTYIKQ